MRKFLCFIGWHGWAYTDYERRHCVHCPRREEAEVDTDFNEITWHRID